MIEHQAHLPLGYSATFTWRDGAMAVEWAPSPPAIRSPRQQRKFREAYNAARREFLTSIATLLGSKVTVCDLDGPIELINPAVKH